MLAFLIVFPLLASSSVGTARMMFPEGMQIGDVPVGRMTAGSAREAVIANDGSVLPGVYVAQTGAAALNRMLKAQTGTAPKGFHVHADGSVHMNH